jgi:uncharacterized protein (DUF4213/DUF364 family)
MKALGDLLRQIPEGIIARRISVGVFWTAVEGLRMGLASTIAEGHPHGDSPVREAGKLEGRPLRELAQLLFEGSLLEASIGLAALNAGLPLDEKRLIEGNASQFLLAKAEGKITVIVGHFPFVEELKKSAKELWVLELKPREGDVDAKYASQILPQAEVIGITSTTLINRTFEGIMRLCPPKSFKMLIGPSTPLSPFLFELGLDALSGALVVDQQKVYKYLLQGATFKQIHKSGAVKLYLMLKC